MHLLRLIRTKKNFITPEPAECPRIIFKKAFDLLATSLILAHNHPSGNLKPSKADIELTKKMKNAGDILEISVLDHVIITDTGYYSFADEGMI